MLTTAATGERRSEQRRLDEEERAADVDEEVLVELGQAPLVERVRPAGAGVVDDGVDRPSSETVVETSSPPASGSERSHGTARPSPAAVISAAASSSGSARRPPRRPPRRGPRGTGGGPADAGAAAGDDRDSSRDRWLPQSCRS
jgi:hypothetical protein